MWRTDTTTAANDFLCGAGVTTSSVWKSVRGTYLVGPTETVPQCFQREYDLQTICSMSGILLRLFTLSSFVLSYNWTYLFKLFV